MRLKASLIILSGWLLTNAGFAGSEVSVLRRAHAHNDYLHNRPLEDALDAGFCSVEADVHLVEGKLLVGHNRQDCRQDRSLKALYLDRLEKKFARREASTRGWPTLVSGLISNQNAVTSNPASIRPAR